MADSTGKQLYLQLLGGVVVVGGGVCQSWIILHVEKNEHNVFNRPAENMELIFWSGCFSSGNGSKRLNTAFCFDFLRSGLAAEQQACRVSCLRGKKKKVTRCEMASTARLPL